MKNVLAFGNPLLDITVTSHNVGPLIKKYHLPDDAQKEVSQMEMQMLSQDIQEFDKHISPGGCSQNSLRVFQWMVGRKGDVATTVFGSVGCDREADILKGGLEREVVATRYIVHKNLPTGKSIALVQGSKRSLAAHLGAAEHFPLKSLIGHPDITFLFNSSDIIFIEAFFLNNRFDTVQYIVKQIEHKNKTLVFNLCGEYLFKSIPKLISFMVEHAKVIFGNRLEFQALAEHLNYSSLELMAKELSKDKLLVITNGARPVECYTNNQVLTKTPTVVEQSEIKDTTAAGDAFTGGFLAGLSASHDLNKCLEMGIYAAASIIRQQGCTLPDYPSAMIPPIDV